MKLRLTENTMLQLARTSETFPASCRRSIACFKISLKTRQHPPEASGCKKTPTTRLKPSSQNKYAFSRLNLLPFNTTNSCDLGRKTNLHVYANAQRVRSPILRRTLFVVALQPSLDCEAQLHPRFWGCGDVLPSG